MDGKKCYIPVMCEGCGGSSGGFPGDEYIEIPLTYTAESNGYIYAVAKSTILNGGGGFLDVNSSNGMHVRSMTCFNNTALYVDLPVKTGSTIDIELTRATLISARFYPAV